MLDAASSVAGKGQLLKAESSKLKEEKSKRRWDTRLGSGLMGRLRDLPVARQRGDFNTEGTEFTEAGGRGR